METNGGRFWGSLIAMGIAPTTAKDPNFYCDCDPNKKICKRPYPPNYYSIEEQKSLQTRYGKNECQNAMRPKEKMGVLQK
jgi:hypothetical protein